MSDVFDYSPLRWKLLFEFSLSHPASNLYPCAEPQHAPSPPRIGICATEVPWLRGDRVYVVDGRRVVVPAYNRYGERFGLQALKQRPPLWTRHMAGVIEGARAKRREWSGRSA